MERELVIAQRSIDWRLEGLKSYTRQAFGEG